MHIILGLLGTIVTILVLVSRLRGVGIDFGWLNPFSWAHRRRWRKKYNADPAFMIESPMEAAAGLLYVAAKSTGEMTQEEKSFILNAFQSDFNLSNSEASDLLSSSAYILKNVEEVANKVGAFLQPSLENFSESQKESTVELVQKLCSLGNSGTDTQQKLLKNINKAFFQKNQLNENWK